MTTARTSSAEHGRLADLAYRRRGLDRVLPRLDAPAAARKGWAGASR
jgi:hypothetical protein